MKTAIIMLLLFFPVTALAQNFQGMNETDMQKMMQQMQKVQQCMENVDQSEMKDFEQRAQKTDAEIKALCAKGKRDKAQKEAIQFSKEVAKIKAIQEIKKCTEMMQGAQGVLSTMPYIDKDTDYSKHHVCDQ